MASFRLLVFAFVRDYIKAYGVSPSQGEIVHAIGTTRWRVRDALRSLVRSGLLLKAPGPRGLMLPAVRDDALRKLRALGWTINPEAKRAEPPRRNFTLRDPLELDYPEPDDLAGEIDGDEANQP